MTGRALSARLAPLVRRATNTPPTRHIHTSRPGEGLRPRTYPSFGAGRRRPWPLGAYSLHNNVVAVRGMGSFARSIPKLFSKFATLGTVAGGATVAGLTYIHNQATSAGNYVADLFNKTKDGASSAASTVYGGATDAFEQTRRGWMKTKEDIGMPTWLQDLMSGGKEESSGSGGPGPEGEPKQSGAGAAAAGTATAAALGYDKSSEDDDRPEERIARDDQMMMLTKKMIQIRGLLQTVGQSEALQLPSIVVIGSQSSGKSSVLEAIVGHEFLPKGSNMVTRRPIELTLVNTPDAHAEYGEFPALGLGKVTDFSQIQKTLTDLNLAVPVQDCVSDDPIQLRIYSPNVPDLSLIDLPGYIQVTSSDQPPELKQKIADLCEKYIQAPNIILAISAADVDLANSTALRSSRKVDPRGERTIGVITKMDLVEPERGVGMLSDKKYGLRLGYVGVICKLPQSSNSLFTRGNGNISSAVMKTENAYFSSHPLEFGPGSELEVGTKNLRKKLMYVLEQTMSASLKSTSEAIQHELAEASYEYKVQYNERPLSAETYLAESLDAFKHSFKGFTEQFGRAHVRELIKHELDQQVLNLLAQRYWNKPFDDLSPPLPEPDSLAELPKADPENPLWHLKLDASSASLTKLGIGRLATTVVANALQSQIDGLISSSTFAAHPFARQTITEASANILRDLSYDISDELEICIKPYKYRIELEDSEWMRGRENISRVLKEELRVCGEAIKHVEVDVGGSRKMKDVMAFIDRVRNGQVVLEGNGIGGAGGFSAALLQKGREAVFLRDRADIIKMRLLAVKSKQCASKKNKYYCPEVFLDAVADKLTTTADLFLDAELLSKFYYSFPRHLDTRLGRNLSPADIDRFAREDPKVQRHLDVVRRKELLEHVLKEMEGLRQLEIRGAGGRRGRGRGEGGEGEKKRRGWSLF
ncbi:putative mitochondrial dynamin GTPase [Aulographum hederae CBS 113979]|uniref:dynamin GTPase n=1 Tax=Aulographum hederae CBS 113979 TaxID=1176131 RepID=A0A6G1HAL0_9PEZI|nr:putative mitochondrial dynamin GTPase [Aulographum hederae CBS 113979]